MKSLVEFILEKQGIFNGCEDIANEIVLQFIEETQKIKERKFTFEFDASKYNPIFRNKIIINVKFKDFSEKKYKLISTSDFAENEDLLKQAISGELLYSDEEIKDAKLKPLEINIESDIFEINLYDLKGLIMHELTHLYTAIIFFDKGENYFNRKYYSPDDWENDSEYLLYFVQKDEVNSWVTEMKPEIDKIKRKGFDNVFNELKNSKTFAKISEFKNKFNDKTTFFKSLGLDEYPDLWRNHFGKDDNSKPNKNFDKSDTEIYMTTKNWVNNAYNQLYRTVIKMLYEYQGTDDFLIDNYEDEIFEPYKWLPEIRSRRRVSKK